MGFLIFATAIWGLGFVGTRWTLTEFSPLWSNGIRLMAAALISTVLIIPLKIYRYPLKLLLKSVVCSCVLYLAMQLQTQGIALTSLAKSGFLTTFYAVFTPILIIIFKKTKIHSSFFLCLAGALLGILLMCELKISNFNRGDMLVLASAFLFSIHILVVDSLAKSFKAMDLNVIQCFVMGIVGVLVCYIVEGAPNWQAALIFDGPVRPSPFLGFFILSVLSSHVAFTAQVLAQKSISPHIAGTIFLMESIFASIFGYIFFGETLSGVALSGCFLVLASIGALIWLEKKKAKVPVTT